MGSQRGSEKSEARNAQARASARGPAAGPRPGRKSTLALRAKRDPRGCSRGSPSRGQGWGRRGVAGGGLGVYHRRMAAPHLVLSGAVSHRLSGDLDSTPPAAPRLTGGRAQQSGQQHQAEALHGCRQHAPGGPREGAGAAGGGRLGHRPGREKPRSGRRPSPLPSSKVPPLFWHPKATSIPESRAWGRRGAPKPRPQPIRESIHHRCTPSREKRPALSLGDGPKCPLLALRTCGMRGGEVGVVGRRVLSLGSRVCVRRGKGRLRCEWTVPAGGGRGARYPHPHLWAGGPGTGAEPPPLSPHASLGSHRGSRRGARASGRGHTHIPGVPRLRGSGRRGRRGEQCPSVSLRTGTRVQPCLSGNAAADTDPARGAGRSRGGGRAGGGGGWSRADGGAWDSGPRRVTVPGCLGPPGQQAPRSPALERALSAPDLFTRALPLPPPPPTRARAGPFPLSLAEIPLEFLGRTFTAKGKERHKDAEREGGSERGRYQPRTLFAALGPSPPRPHHDPDGSRLFSAPPPPRRPHEQPQPQGLLPPTTPTLRGQVPNPGLGIQGPLPPALVRFSALSLAFCSHHACPAVFCTCCPSCLSPVSAGHCWALLSAGRGASANVLPSVPPSSVRQTFMQTAWDHTQVCDCRHMPAP